MLSSLFFLASSAWASCPDAASAIQSAERDVVSYYISDAQNSLVEAAAAFECSKADSALLARYWLAQGMIWHLGEDDRYQSALAAAKILEPSLYTEDFGPELREEWETATRVPGDVVSLIVKGKSKGDSVMVDGMLSEPPEALPGMHLLQIRRGGEIVFGRLMRVDPGLTATLDVRVAGPKPTPPSAEAPPPFETPVRVKRGLRDASGVRLDTFEIAAVAARSPEGLRLLQKHRRVSTLQIPAIGLAGAGAYGTYLGVWEANVGDTLSPGDSTLLLGTSLLALVGGTTWEVLLRTKRRRLRKRLASLTNGVAP